MRVSTCESGDNTNVGRRDGQVNGLSPSLDVPKLAELVLREFS